MQKSVVAGLAGGLAVFFCQPAMAAKVGPEFRANTNAAGSQREPDVAGLINGGFVVTWEGPASGNQNAIFHRRYDSSGIAQGAAFRSDPVQTGRTHFGPPVVSSYKRVFDGRDGFAVTWSFQEGPGDFGYNTALYSPSGARLGDYEAYSNTRPEPATAGGEDRGLLRAYESIEPGFGYDIRLSPQFIVNRTRAGDQRHPAAGTVRGGAGQRFAILWESSGQDGSGKGIFGAIYVPPRAQGQTGEFPVNTFTAGDQFDPAVDGLYSNARSAAVWTSQGQDGSLAGVYGQVFGYQGSHKFGPEFRANTYTFGEQSDPDVAALTGGDFVVTWTSRAQDGSNYGVYAQRFSLNGAKIGSEFRVNTTTFSTQWQPAIAALQDGGYVIVWSSYRQDGDQLGIFGQRFSP